MQRWRTVFSVVWIALIAAWHAPAAEAWPKAEWPAATPAEVGLDATKLAEAREYALTGGGSGYITRHGNLVLSWGDPRQRYDLKSTTKSFGCIALGLAIKDGKVRLADKANQYHPTLGVPPESNAESGWVEEITLLHLATQTAGFEKPGGYTHLLFRPGTQWDYSDSGPNWLAECLTLACRCDLDELMFERVFTPLGIQRSDLVWRKNQYRPALIDGLPRREFGAGISANVDALARIGLLMLREGRWMERQIIPREFVAAARSPAPGAASLFVHTNSMKEAGAAASRHYGLLWWNNADGTLANVPRDAFWSWGLYDSLILVIPSLDIAVARAGQSWKRQPGAPHYDVLRPFFEPIAGAVIPNRSGRREEAHSFTAVNRKVPGESERSLLTSAAAALPLRASFAQRLLTRPRRKGGHAFCRRAGSLRCARAMGTMDERLLLGKVGRGSRRYGQLPGQVDEC